MSSPDTFSPSRRSLTKRTIYAVLAIFFAVLGCIAAVWLIIAVSSRSSSPIAASPPRNTESEPALSFSIEPLKYGTAKWDGSGPGYDGEIQNPSQVWMSKRGFIVFNLSLPQEGSVTVRTRLSSEMLNTVSANPQDSSDVTLYLNGESLGSKRVLPDDRVGQ